MSFNYYNYIKNQADQWSATHPNCIPLTTLPRFSEHVSITKGTYYLITANSGVGKSRFVKHCFIHNAIEFARHSSINLKIVLFSLEEGIDRFFLLEICRQLYIQFGIELGYKQLLSRGMNRLSKDVLDKIKIIEKEHISELNKCLTVLDVRDIHKINKYMLNVANEVGTVHTKPVKYTDGVKEEFDRYSVDDNTYVMAVIDHVKLTSGESTIKNTIDKLSSNYAVTWRNRFNFIPVIVQQQVAGKEAKQFTNRGMMIESMEPSLDGLGEHKLTQQDADIVIGLFNPHRYRQTTHNGYDITKLKGGYRSATILKNRDGLDDLSVGMEFKGASGIFNELPRPEDELIKQFYG